jgi:hypothetical protein
MFEPRKTKPVVFFSHSGNDAYLEALKRYMPDYEVVVSDWQDASGTRLADKVITDVRRSDLVMVVLTDGAHLSVWVNQEIGFALGLGKKVLPISDGDSLPALLAGGEFVPFNPSHVDTSAMKAALRVARWLQEDLTRVFKTYHEYRTWWINLDERVFKPDKIYWATPHDTWSWVMAHNIEERQVPYKTLIRGNTNFDRMTLATYYRQQEAVCDVDALAAYEEVVVIGALSVETTWEPSFWRQFDEFLRTMSDTSTLFQWYQETSSRQTSIEVRMLLDQDRADRHRRRLDFLFDDALKRTL